MGVLAKGGEGEGFGLIVSAEHPTQCGRECVTSAALGLDHMVLRCVPVLPQAIARNGRLPGYPSVPSWPPLES